MSIRALRYLRHRGYAEDLALASDRKRSGSPAPATDFLIGSWTVRPQRDCIESSEGIVHLAPKAMAVLVSLARAQGTVVTRQELFASVWPACEVTDDALTQRVVELRRAFGDSAREPAVIETIPKVGFRLMQQAVPASQYGAPRGGEVSGSRQRTRTSRLLMGAGVMSLVLAIGYFIFEGSDSDHDWPSNPSTQTGKAGGTGDRPQPLQAKIPPRSVAVLPFDMAGLEGDDLQLADALHEEILVRLTKISSLKVTAHASVERYRNSDWPMRRIARELGVATVLMGSMQYLEDKVRIRLQLVDADSGEYLWAERFDRELSADSYFAIQSEIAGQVAGALDISLSPEESLRLAEVPTENFEVYRALLKGRVALDEGTVEGFERALAHYTHALKLNPGFAQAHVAIAAAYSTALEDRGISQTLANTRIEEHALRALDLDPGLGHAYKFLAQVLRVRGQYEEAEALFRRALELDPGNVNILHGLGLTMRLRGRLTESIPYYDRAVELDPLSPIINESRGSLLRDLGRFEEAEQQYRMTLELSPGFVWAYWGLGTLHWSRGDPAGAIEEFQRAVHFSPRGDVYWSWLALMHLELQQDTAARAVLDEAFGLIPMSAENDAALVEELYGIYHGLDIHGLPDGRRFLPAGMFGGLVQLPVRELLDNRYSAALDRYEEQYPGISTGAIPIDGSNYRSATYVAFALDRLGEPARAVELLNRIETLLVGMRRLGIHGYWVTDAQIAMVRGNRLESLRLLEAAIQEGWRNLWRFYFFHDPILEDLRGNPKFASMARLIEQDMIAVPDAGIALRIPELQSDP